MPFVELNEELRQEAVAFRGDIIVSRGRIHKLIELDGFVYVEENRILASVFYHIAGDRCEIVSLDSKAEGRGIGSELIQLVIHKAQSVRCARVWLITSNDNMRAIKFYQKRGFEMAGVHRDAITEARKLKPTIPLTGYEGIPIKHEVEFEYILKEARMRTVIYMVRHAESPYNEGTERTRGLTPDGLLKSEKVTEILKHEGIDAIISSPYTRATLTLEGLANHLNLEIKTYEDLRERHFADENYHSRGPEFMESIRKSFEDFNLALPGGESNRVCQQRAVAVLERILQEHVGRKVAIGTHGNVMALMMNHFDSSYGWEFVNRTSKPDIYKLQFEDSKLVEVTKLWNE